VATGYLDLTEGSVEAIFTLPDFFGKGFASLIIETIKEEAMARGLKQLTLTSTPNAQTFYEKHGFMFKNDIPIKTCPNRSTLHGYVHHTINLSYVKNWDSILLQIFPGLRIHFRKDFCSGFAEKSDKKPGIAPGYRVSPK
jgi:hypothetical protein